MIHAARLRRAEAHEGRNAVSVGTGEGVRAHERAGDGAERADRDENSRIRPRFRLVGEEGVIFTALLRVRVERAVHASARHFLLGCQTTRRDTRDAVTRSLASARVARRCDEFAPGARTFFLQTPREMITNEIKSSAQTVRPYANILKPSRGFGYNTSENSRRSKKGVEVLMVSPMLNNRTPVTQE